jgi:transcriptional regulator with XRE-family HTH domain
MKTTAGNQATARARELGGELKQIRENAQLTGERLAGKLGWSPSKISRLESGIRGTSDVDIVMLLAMCGAQRGDVDRILELVREADGYRLRPHGSQLPDELRTLVFQETTATTTTSFELARLPGLLQTEDYAREIITRSVSVPADGVEARVRARMARQNLMRRQWPPRFYFYIHEQALRLPVGGSKVMHEQLLTLVFATSLANCRVRVVPTAVGAHAGLGGPFMLMDYDKHAPTVYVENERASLFLDTKGDIAAYRKAIIDLASVALNEGQSREWLANLASEHDRAEGGTSWERARTPT